MLSSKDGDGDRDALGTKQLFCSLFSLVILSVAHTSFTAHKLHSEYRINNLNCIPDSIICFLNVMKLPSYPLNIKGFYRRTAFV